MPSRCRRRRMRSRSSVGMSRQPKKLWNPSEMPIPHPVSYLTSAVARAGPEPLTIIPRFAENAKRQAIRKDLTEDDDVTAHRRGFYGWGFGDYAVSPDELAWFERAWSKLLGADHFDPAPMPRESEIALPAPRVSVPPALQAFCTVDKHERLLHCYGRSVHDLARMILRRDFSNPPDVVACPRDERDICAVLDWCGANNLAAIPLGGGTSVVGGVNPPADEGYRGTVTIDLRHFSHVLEIDQTSRAARIQCGVLGPDLERQLNPSGLTLRFFLEAWEFSSLGGCAGYCGMSAMQPASCGQALIEISEHHRENNAERAMEAPNWVRKCMRMLVDRGGDPRMGQLEKQRTAGTQEDGGFPVDAPG